MSNELTTTSNKADFIKQLNQATGNTQRPPRPMNIKFDAVNGTWMREINEKEDGSDFNKWVDMGQTISFHLITTRKKYKATNADHKIYSKEFNSKYITLQDASGATLFNGTAADLKKDSIKDFVKFVQVVYAFVGLGKDGAEDVLLKINLSGSNLINLFPYLASFDQDESVSAIYTVATRSIRMKGDGKGKPMPATEADIAKYNSELDARKKPTANLYYMVDFTRGGDVPMDAIIDRVNGVNQYLAVVNKDNVDLGGGISGEVVDDVDMPEEVSFNN